MDGALWPYLLISEQLAWNMVIVGHEDEATARKQAAKYLSCWILVKHTSASNTGNYEEISRGGLSAPFTLGWVHPRIRKWILSKTAAQLAQMASRS